MKRSWLFGVLATLLVASAFASTGSRAAGDDQAAALAAIAAATIPPGPEGDLISYGRDLIVNTQKHPELTIGASMSCQACHLNAGTLAHGGSFVGIYAKFPQWNERSGHFITLQDRLAECFLYSMNGTPPAYTSRAMIAMTAYIAFVSRGAPVGEGFTGQGFVTVTPAHAPDPVAGQALFKQQCTICHGADGAGDAQAGFPPLWGPTSFNDGAGMNRKMASFVKANMPLGAGGSLTDQQAADVSAFILSHPRPHFDKSRLISWPAVPAGSF
jgi:thiosulfate dehydrogenase